MELDLKALAKESFWVEKYRYSDAERDYYQNNNSSANTKKVNTKRQNCHKSELKEVTHSVTSGEQTLSEQKRNSSQINTTSIVSDIVRARKLINKTLDSETNESVVKTSSGSNPLNERINELELENRTIKKTVNDLRDLVSKLELRVSSLEGSAKQDNKPKVTAGAVNQEKQQAVETKKSEDNDSDIDLFGSEEDEEADEVRKKRLEEYAAKKNKKPGVIAKSSVVLDVKPWDDETNMEEMEKRVRAVEMDGLLWGASKLVPLAYGIRKLQIVIVIEDDKVSVEELTEKLEEIDDYVQSVDIAAFNKI